MLAKLKALPIPLKIVAWLNIVLAVLSLFSLFVRLTSIGIGKTPDRAIIDFGSAIISVLVVMGILQKSKSVRSFALIMAWLSIGTAGLMFFVSIFAAIYAPHHNWLLVAEIMAIPLMVSGAIAWGLMTNKSKIYFGLISNDEKSIRSPSLRPAH